MKIRSKLKAGGLVTIILTLTLTLAMPTQARLNPGAGRAVAIPGHAQLDPGTSVGIFQNGIKTGEIYVPYYTPQSINYIEHWVLFNNYVYPGKDPSLMTTLQMARRGYENEADFFARVPWGSGFRYVRVYCTDTDQMPGR